MFQINSLLLVRVDETLKHVRNVMFKLVMKLNEMQVFKLKKNMTKLKNFVVKKLKLNVKNVRAKNKKSPSGGFCYNYAGIIDKHLNV